MHVKDAMRELCIVELAEAWYQLVSGYKDSQPELAAMVLEAVQKYINWIDISLVANDKWVPNPPPPPHPAPNSLSPLL